MKNNDFRKGLVLVIIILFAITSIIPNIAGGSISSFTVGAVGATDYATALTHQRKMARDGDGNLYCVYRDNDSDIKFAKSIDCGESWSVTELSGDAGVAEVTTYGQTAPAIAVDSSNNLHVVWKGTHAGSETNTQIRYSKYNGVSWSAPINLTTDSDYVQVDPSIAVDSSDNVYVFFHGEHVGSPFQVQLRYTEYNGVSWSAVTNITAGSYSSIDVCIAIDGSDNLHIVWTGYHAGSPFAYQIRYSKYNGVSWSAPINLTTDSTKAQGYACIAIDSSDNLHVVWDGTNAGTSLNQIRYSKYNGVSWSAPINLTAVTIREQLKPSITIDSSDNLHVVWYGYHDGSTSIYQIRCINYTGGGWGAVGELTSDATDDQMFPSTLWARYPSGINVPVAGFCFIWTDTNNDNVVFYKTSDFTIGDNVPPNVPSDPQPPDGAEQVDVNEDLSWSGGDPNGDSVTYDVYFEAGDSTPDVKVSSNQSETTYDPGTMDYNETYYWKIVAWEPLGNSTAGPVWSFTTEENLPPNTPSDPVPENGATDVYFKIILRWTGGDPNDGDTITYSVYLGKSSPPPLVDEVTTDRYDPGTLELNAMYYWQIIAEDSGGLTSTGPIWSFTTEKEPNAPPKKPYIYGPHRGPPGVELCWAFDSDDPDENPVKYIIEWGDGNSDETEYSTMTVEACHTYEEQGEFTIKAKAIDTKDAESDWATLDVTMPKNKIYIFNFPLLSWLFERFTNMFPILIYLVGL